MVWFARYKVKETTVRYYEKAFPGRMPKEFDETILIEKFSEDYSTGDTYEVSKDRAILDTEITVEDTRHGN